MLPGELRSSGREEFCSGTGGVCVASGINIKNEIHWEGLPKGRRVTRGRGGCLEVLALYMHTKIVVASFSCFGDTKEVPKSKSRSRDPTPDTI